MTGSDSREFFPYPRQVSRSFRDQVLALYPALAADTPRGRAYRAMAEYALFNIHASRNGAGIILPFQTVAQLVGVGARTRGFSAGRWIREFSEDVFELSATPYSYSAGQATEIQPEVAAEILLARDHELVEHLGQKEEWIYFVDGVRVSERRRRKQSREYVQHLRARSEMTDTDHPAWELREFLNGQPTVCLEKVVRENWPAVRQAALDMPQETEAERGRRDAALRVLLAVQDRRVMIYGTSGKTVRLHALDINIHLLPRELRKLILRGCISLDLRACQLAVLAAVWDVPVLSRFLKLGNSVWKELLNHLLIGEEYKAILKKTIYALAYGMGRRKLSRQLSRGESGAPGVGDDVARKFFRQPLITALLKARKSAQRRVQEAGGAEDAFGRWISTEQFIIPSVLAQQAQSYELRVMMAMLPILKAERDVRVVSWLHDGITIRILDPADRTRIIRRLQEAVETTARGLGIHTCLESEA